MCVSVLYDSGSGSVVAIATTLPFSLSLSLSGFLDRKYSAPGNYSAMFFGTGIMRPVTSRSLPGLVRLYRQGSTSLILRASHYLSSAARKSGTSESVASSRAVSLLPPCAESARPPPLPPSRSPTMRAIVPALRPRFVVVSSIVTMKRAWSSCAAARTNHARSELRTASPSSRSARSSATVTRCATSGTSPDVHLGRSGEPASPPRGPARFFTLRSWRRASSSVLLGAPRSGRRGYRELSGGVPPPG